MDGTTVDLDVDYDPNVLIGVPREYPVEDFESPQDWADEMAAEMVEGGELPFQLRDEVAAMLEVYGRFALDVAGDGVITYLHFPRVDEEPMVVALEVMEPPENLRDLVDADDRAAVREPVVEEVTSPTLGTGVRVLRLVEVEGTLEGALEYGFVVGETAIKVSVFTDDVARLTASIPDLDAFVSSITVNSAEPA